MPASITHELVGEETLRRLPELAEKIQPDSDYFYLGTQGGDLFFFYQPLGREYNFGRYLHRQCVYGLFTAFLNVLQSLPEPDRARAFAYCCGYITHYSADCVFHPFIYRLLEAEGGGKSEHLQIENDWDVYFVTTLSQGSAEHYGFGFDKDRILREGTLYRFFAAVAPEIGRKELKKGSFNRALRSFCFYLKAFHKNCYKSSVRIERAGKALPVRSIAPVFPRERTDERYLGGDKFQEYAGGAAVSCEELFEKAVLNSVSRIALFQKALGGEPLPRSEFNKHLLTGEEIGLSIGDER